MSEMGMRLACMVRCLSNSRLFENKRDAAKWFDDAVKGLDDAVKVYYGYGEGV